MEAKKVNWKVRFKNKVWLTSFFAAILTFVYTMLGMFDVYPEVTKNDVGEIINSLLMFLSLIGVVVDPTTTGLYDSARALGYEEPWDDNILDDGTEIHEADAELGTDENAIDPIPEEVMTVVDEGEPES